MLNHEDISKGGERVPVLAEPCVLKELQKQEFVPTVIESTMPTIIRIKRKLNEDPADVLLISCKRKKLEENEGASSTTPNSVDESIFHFATTVKMHDTLDKEVRERVKEAVSTRMKYTEKNRLKYQPPGTNSNDEHCFASLKNKLKAVRGQKRTTISNEKGGHSSQTTNGASETLPKPRNSTSDATPSKQSKQEVLVPSGFSETYPKDKNADDILCNSVKMIREKLTVSEPKDDYVVDVYYCSKDVDWKQRDVLDIKPCKYEDFIWELSDNEDNYDIEDDDDSNDENNWRNDYPDEEDSIDEDERRFVFDEEEYNNTEDCDVRDRDFYEGGYGDFEQILNDYNPLAMDSCEDFPVLYGSENDDDY